MVGKIVIDTLAYVIPYYLLTFLVTTSFGQKFEQYSDILYTS